jgi:hypothetical protein
LFLFAGAEERKQAGNGRKRKTMKLEEIKNKTNEAVSYLVAALESGQNDILTQSQRDGPIPQLRLWKYHADRPTEAAGNLNGGENRAVHSLERG